MKAKIISAFPGCGKTYSFNHRKNDFAGILDSDSSNFSWLFDAQGNPTKQRNPNFPQNYIQHIKDNLDKVEIIFISSHKQVRDALKENDLPYVLIYPSIDQKEKWLEIFKKRGNYDEFIKFISDNWDTFINDMKSDDFPQKIELPYKDNYQITGDLLLEIINYY